MTQSMYQDYFGISENPFSIIPDPHYLYMSQRHQEALAHLLYGIGESGGFVLLTGEVGTGKTTICRALLEQLPGNTDLALILNPKLTETELMAAICDEMRIPYPLGTVSLKDFFDLMNEHLLKAHAEGRNPVLLVDEAQNLSSDVLEVVRLLTNLETVDKKLLQIILVGQPELNTILALPMNRQTNQRITARYHLNPLTLPETRSYIRHRLKVAGLDGRTFSNRAFKIVHKNARGIPRLINSICDRALLAAYVEGRKVVSAKLAKHAGKEVRGADHQNVTGGLFAPFAFAVSVTALLFIIAFDPFQWNIKGHFVRAQNTVTSILGGNTNPAPGKADQDTQIDAITPTDAPTPQAPGVPNMETQDPPAPPHSVPAPAPQAPQGEQQKPTPQETSQASLPPATDAAPAKAETSAPPAPTAAPVAEVEIVQATDALLGDLAKAGSPDRAFVLLFTIWNENYLTLSGLTPCDKAQSAALNCLQGKTDVNGLKTINRPVVVPFKTPDEGQMYGVVSDISNDIGGDIVTIDFGDRAVSMPAGTFEESWPGDYLVLWKPHDTFIRQLLLGQSGPDVVELRRLLNKAGLPGGNGETYDATLRQTVQDFQHSLRIEADGIAGPETIMRLTGVAGETFTPKLWAEE